MYHGVARSEQSDEERETAEGVLATKPGQPADTAVMQKAGRISGELENGGEGIADGDVIIGTTAAVVGEPVLTRDVPDFDRVGCVEVETC